MGANIVNNDFYAVYIAATYTREDHQFSTRLDWYQVIDKDSTIDDPNNSRGEAVTINYTYAMSSRIALSAEWQVNRGRQENLRFLNAASVSDETFHENLLQLAITYRLD